MKAFLLYRDHDFDKSAEAPANHEDLTTDLDLDTLVHAMAGEDEFVADVCRSALLQSVTDPAHITYRQDVLRDCLAHPDAIRDLYQITVDTIAAERHIYRTAIGRSPDLTLHRSVEVLQIFMDALRKLRAIADDRIDTVSSDGLRTLFAMLSAELSDDYLARVDQHLERLKFRGGVLISARLGKGNKGTRYVLRKPRQVRPTLRERLGLANHNAFTLTIPDRDESGARALGDLRGRGIGLVASALARSTDHILAFFAMLRTELAFYLGCINLADTLATKQEPICYPVPRTSNTREFSAHGLYDICLSLRLDERVVPNTVSADNRSLVTITGANQGGKSTFLRSVGLAHLMMQAGMFAPAETLTASTCTGLFTHYKREEDRTMTSGKLDEELARMSTIADHIRPAGLLLCNESFASTNEREGSEIAAEIIRAFRENNVRIFFVTHLYDLAERLHDDQDDEMLFLRAERESGGRRTFKLTEAAPLPTSYGADLYDKIFRPADRIN